jgi:NADPH:quinone reductase-like Zn-dependent oxidoreductase
VTTETVVKEMNMRALQFHDHGEPADVLRLGEAEVPTPGPGQIRIAVQACGLTPADWALCGGLFAGDLPRGIGLEVSGTVDALGEGVGEAVADDRGGAPGDTHGADGDRGAPAGGASGDRGARAGGASGDRGARAGGASGDRGARAGPESGDRGPAAVGIGDPVFGPAPFRGPTAGAAEFALLDVWFPRPAGLDPVDAAALPMAVETATRGLEELGVQPGQTVLISGAGTTVGYAAVQIAQRLGAHVLATAGETYAGSLRALGAQVTGYDDGVIERVRALAGGPVDLVLDTAPPSNTLPSLIEITGSPRRVVTLSDFAAARELGVRGGIGGSATLRYDVLGEFAQLAAKGEFSIPIAGVYPLDEWRTPMELSRSGNARGKLVLKIS